jgi:ferredoxin/flavodoxin---NADP+ reductase
MTTPGTAEHPLRVAIVGAGPSGFYAAGHLLKNKQMPELVAQVDMFDRLPTPWGLVRGGVAPDHPKIKSVSRVYEKTAALEGFRFFGNVELGRDISREELREHYHVIIYAFGAETDRKMGIDGEDLPGSWAATEFVAWYNGHPDYRELEFDLSHKRAVVIGNGNVAVDVARMLALTEAELAVTDIADHALDVLRASKLEEIVIVGRRGPAQAAFTTPELLELGELADADIVVDPTEIALDEHSERALDDTDATRKRNLEVMKQYAERTPTGKRKRVILRFLSSPVTIVGEQGVEAIELVRNELRPGDDGSLRAHATDERETLEAGLVFRSIGYRGIPIDSVPFDDRAGTIPNQSGRVLDPDTDAHLPGEYAVGWIKRGPTGVIGTNKKDAQETVDAIVEDVREGRLPDPTDPDPETVVELLNERAPNHVDYSGWQAIDAAEQAAGTAQDRPRVKLTTFEELIAAAVASRDGAGSR